MRGSPSTRWRVRVLKMSESMQETMKREQEELLATLTRANSALSRIFGIEEQSVGNCAACNSWCDNLEAGICQTCISKER